MADNQDDVFSNFLLAAMKDAIFESKLTQLKVEFNPDGKGLKQVRVIVIPEKMDFDFNPALGSTKRIDN